MLTKPAVQYLSILKRGLLEGFLVGLSIVYLISSTSPGSAVAPSAVQNPTFSPAQDNVVYATGFLPVGRHCGHSCGGGCGEGCGSTWCINNLANPIETRYLWPTCPAGWHIADTELGPTNARFCIGSDQNLDASDDRADSQIWIMCAQD